ncbi:MAG: hypothetical protein GXO64_03340 [Candidatus Micrarchaeota archaeon]|nr:hypothetical protein [Candidatus Micrarchaeota archaeon]
MVANIDDDNKLKLVENFVLRSFKKINNEKRIKYLQRTAHWTSVLSPKTTSALKIAALGYDIERAFRRRQMQFSPLAGEKDAEYRQKESARIMKEFLEKNNFPKHVSDKVYNIISGHLTGNEREHKILRDADRINYFENIAIRRSRASGLISPDSIKSEFERKFSDISTKKAKEIAEPFYRKALQELNKK